MNNILELSKKFKQDIADISSEHIVVDILIYDIPRTTIETELPDVGISKKKDWLGDYLSKHQEIEKNLTINLFSKYE
jgi:hypothetical protein